MKVTTVLALGFLVVGGCKAADKAPPPPAVVVGIAELVGDYKANEVRADTKYKGKRVQVTGIVGEVRKNAFDQIEVHLGQGKQIDFETVSCGFPKESTDKAAALDKGAAVTVDCECKGKILTFVNMGDCQFVGAPPAAAGSGAVASKDAPPATQGASAEDVCQKLIAGGVAKSCAKGASGVDFEIVGMPGKKGTVVHLDDDAKFAKYVAGATALPPTAAARPFFSSAKARSVVHLRPDVPAAIVAKAKAVVDGL